MKRLLAWGAYLALCFLLLEAVARGYWTIAHGTGFFASPTRVAHEVFYPELRAAGEAPDPDVQTVLLLGASALHPEFGNVETRLRRVLEDGGKRVRIVNLSVPAQSSRDSYLKYRFLEDRRFDLVLVYHGINEVRANNVPPELFREDYGHYAWYERVNRLEEGAPWSVLGFTLGYLADEVKRRLRPDEYVPEHRPDPRWVDYGADVKTAASFEKNLEGILRIAKRRDDPVLLMTFASYLAPGYSEEAMDEAKLDYTDSTYSYPVETWGRPANVVAGIRAHNDVMRKLAAAHPEAGFVDQERGIPPGRRNFVDICHLTKPGSRVFVRNAIPEIRRALDRRGGEGASTTASSSAGAAASSSASSSDSNDVPR